MKDNLNKDYLRYLFYKTQLNLTRYHISQQDAELIRKIFEKFNNTENLPAELYIFFNIKEFRNLSKYFIFILKKIEDNLINFDNLLQNIHSDSEYLEKEILNYLSNPSRKSFPDLKFPEEKEDNFIESAYLDKRKEKEESAEKETISDDITDIINKQEESEFTKNYLELIQSDEKDEEVVYELPDSHAGRSGEESGSPFDLPDFVTEFPGDEESDDKNEMINDDTINVNDDEESENQQAVEHFKAEVSGEAEDDSEIVTEEFVIEDVSAEQENNSVIEEDRIRLSEEIQEELNLFKESDEVIDEEEDATEEEPAEVQPANELFLEYENEIRTKNTFLEKEFNAMISMLNSKPESEYERAEVIKSIIETSRHLENISRNISLEIISNIYQTIMLSFEKISDSKYDLSESTLNLFKKGLSLVLSLVKGDDYYGYKDILKSIENIRNSLLEERQKRENYLKRLREKMDLENNLNKKYPDDFQKEKILVIKQIIKETDLNFRSLENISGEYQIYEALRSLSGSLNNFKDIVKISKELNMKKLVQMAESGYIFIKFLQNYRINPVTIEIKEIFGYIIYNLKSLVIGKQPDDLDLFISYLNDPVKIFSKTNKKNK